MKLDLTSPFTAAEVAALLASEKDDQNWQLRVTDAGEAFLSKDVGNKNIKGIKFRFETFCAGNDYVGPNAARDAKWVARIYKALTDNWPSPAGTYIDHF